jgi:uncharacterized membrane protein YjfL (UPF0719 family)
MSQFSTIIKIKLKIMKSIIIIQVFIAFVFGLSALFLLYRLLNYFMRKRFQIEETNTSFAIFQVGILLSGSLILSSVLSAAVNAIQFLNQAANFNMQSLMISLAYVVVFVLIGIIFTLALIASAVFIFFQLTQINEWDQIKLNNIPTALISAALILGLSMIMDDYIGHLCEALIPYPAIMQIR